MAKNITPQKEDFSKWYLDVIAAGELADYSPVRGCMIIRPTGFAIWEKMQAILDRMFKETGHQNAYFPLLIPDSFLKKESKHIEGFSPELAVVTHGGGNKLEEPLAVRPTSETIIGHMYAKWLNSYRDLPILINQWCNVLRWEMRTKLFLRTSEFLWQEGHTAHATEKEAKVETLKMLEVYRVFLEDYCAIPVITGEKPEHEKFPGATETYTLEAMMQDKKFLQSGTSHNLGQNFSRAFDIKFLNRQNQMELAWTTSWGVSTRMIGGVIMTHADDDGLILPPKIASTQIVLIPIFKKDQEEEVLEYTEKVYQELSKKFDFLVLHKDLQTHQRAIDRFFHWIQKGIPLRIEIGLKEAESQSCVLVRRNSKKKQTVDISQVALVAKKELELLHDELLKKAQDFQKENTKAVKDYEELKDFFEKKGGALEVYWDGEKETAEKIQEQTKATIRLILGKAENQKCIYSSRQAKYKVLLGIAY
jgi:prolyl-tRNA synthetase